MTEDEFVALSREKYQKLQVLNKINDFYEYEKTFDTIWTAFGRESLEKNIGELPQNHQKKTLSEPDTEK
jgi:bisphosphoglycerate-independent phosphoglycerate mutase (AlkP superfamily)